MARADRRRAAREARHARASGSRRARGGSRSVSAQSVESQLFFTRLRSQAKWAFALMVIVFGAGFAFLGVGSGGLDLGQMIRDTFGSKGGGGPSISDAQQDVAKHPRQASAYKKLADAYERKGRRDDAISALEQYTKLKPKDVQQLQRLANLRVSNARDAAQELQIAYLTQQSATAGQTFGASPSSKFAQSLGQNPIESLVSTNAQQRTQTAQSRFQTTSTAAIATLKRVVKTRPDEASYFQLARTAEEFGDANAALAAYKALVKLVPDAGTKRSIRTKIVQLQALAKRGGG